ncbi:hypothetical protein JQK88_30685 [Mesorhizobium caraganae]|nr:hypothetical protein [Mesorhizobium caraganae]
MRKTVQLLLFASLYGCVATTPPRPEPAASQRADPIAVSLALEETITIGVRQHLKNPVAATFGPILAGERTVNGRKEIVVCGSVDDRNAAGGSADYEPFLGRIYPDADNSFELAVMGNTQQGAIADACRAAGLPIDTQKS